MSYITRRDGRYSYRRKFPKSVAAAVGRAEYRKALGTADRSEALKLARAVSVEFDRICEAAVAGLPQSENTASGVPSQSAADVLSSLDAVVRSFTLDVVDRMSRSNWRTEVEWRKQALEAHAQGQMPPGVQMHPVTARAALRALDDILEGNLTQFCAPTPGEAVTAVTTGDTITEATFQTVLDDYCEGVGPSRVQKMRSLTRRVLVWPSSQSEQLDRVMLYCAERLEAGGKATSVHGDAAGLITVLRRVPGWQSATLPKVGAVARAVRSGGGMNVNQRESIPLEQMLNVHAEIHRQAPVHHSTVLLLARYGLRPGELLQEGPEALGYRVDILGNRELVFKAALTGGKNAASRRDIPVHADDVELFKEVLGGLDLASDATPVQRDKRIRQRVQNVSRIFSRLLGHQEGLSLYSQRHTLADLLREVGATPDEVGGILGHTATGSKATSIYGGKQSLSRPRELLAKVREHIPD
ncbi:DUF6538 domain-containing protein [Pseudomonas savastanoi]|nr:DUF6538 domain-containing protein [Pseudomonas savastanoi]EFW81300.1 hypothetical protein PsgB076_07397 [Pseudomonas savastanoi pv. glycinea str. B076]